MLNITTEILNGVIYYTTTSARGDETTISNWDGQIILLINGITKDFYSHKKQSKELKALLDMMESIQAEQKRIPQTNQLLEKRDAADDNAFKALAESEKYYENGNFKAALTMRKAYERLADESIHFQNLALK